MHIDTLVITSKISGFEMHKRMLREEYYNAVGCIVKKVDLIKADIFPFGYSDELELNENLLSYIDRSIALMEYIKRSLNLGDKCPKILGHTLLREFRNFNHHEGYRPIYPVRTNGLGTDFFVYHPFLAIPKIQQLEWAREMKSLTILELINWHQKYVDGINEKTVDAMRKQYQNKWVKMNPKYFSQMEMGFGRNYLEELNKNCELSLLDHPPVIASHSSEKENA